MKDLAPFVKRGGVPAVVAGWLALGWWPLPQLFPRLMGHPLDLRTALVTVLAVGSALWYVASHKEDR